MPHSYELVSTDKPFGKSFGVLSINSLGNRLRTLWTSLGNRFTTLHPRLFNRLYQTLVSYRCSLGFTVYRLHCGILELFPYNALGQVCPCTSRKPKSDKLLKSLGVVWKTSPSGEPECLGIFWRQTPRLQTLPRAKFFQTTPVAFQLFVPVFLRVASERSQSDPKKNQSIFLPLMTLVNESPKEFWFGVLEDLLLDLCFWPDLVL